MLPALDELVLPEAPEAEVDAEEGGARCKLGGRVVTAVEVLMVGGARA